MLVITVSEYNVLVGYLLSMGFHSSLCYGDEISEETCKHTINDILNLLDIIVADED